MKNRQTNNITYTHIIRFYIPLLLAVFNFQSSQAQIVKHTTYYNILKTKVDEVFYLDASTGYKHGQYKKYKNGLPGIYIEGTYNQGYKTGKWVYNLPLVTETVPYLVENYNSKGILHGEYIGKPELIGGSKFIGRYNNGQKDGKWVQYFMNSPKVVDVTSNYNNGVLHGEYKTFYESGFLRTKSRYVKGNIVDSAFGYLDTDKEPKLAGITIFDNNGKQIKFISVQDPVKDLNEVRSSLLAKYILPVEPDFENYQQVKYLQDSLFAETRKAEYLETKHSEVMKERYLKNYLPEKITQKQYDSLIQALKNAENDKDVPLTEADKKNAIICLYQLCKLNGKLSDKYKYELTWELKGNGRIDYAVKLKDRSEAATLSNFIEYDDMPAIELSVIRFSCRFAKNWVMQKLIYYASLDEKITQTEVDYMNTISQIN